MEDEIFNQEDILQNDASGEDNLSSDQSVTLEDKLDRVEALLNEDIALRSTGSGQEVNENDSSNFVSSSGVESPDYSQYIYDYLTDSTVKVEIVRQDIMRTPLNDYNLTDALLVVTLLCLFGMVLYNFIEKHVFKRRR